MIYGRMHNTNIHVDNNRIGDKLLVFAASHVDSID